ncbi:MAG: NUDIX domain-containing protein [Inquilinaceae bacterium]
MSSRPPERPVVGVGVVVWRGDQVLLVKRGRPPREGQWGLPGGRQELGETVFEAAVREVREETGLTVAPLSIVTVVDSIDRDDNGVIAFHYTLVEVVAEWRAGEAVAADDAADVRWADPDALDGLVAWDETRRVIRLSRTVRGQAPSATPEPCLRPRPAYDRLMRSPLGRMVARPWLDDMTLLSLRDWVLPLSRARAVAEVSNGNLDAFLDQLDVSPDRVASPRLMERHLRAVDGFRRQLDDANAEWESTLFGPGAGDPAARVAAEEARLDASTTLTWSGLRFALFARHQRIERCRWEIPSVEEVAARHGARLSSPATAYALPDPLPEVEESRHVASPLGMEYWIRFPSPDPDMGDLCWARVFEPAGVVRPPTVIHLHGVCMEADHIRGPLREVEAFCRRGLRVITPEAPWHGRRRLPGRYGGEPFVARTPQSALDHFSAHVRELAVLTGWARRSGAPVGWSGLSLGAFCAQLAATHAGAWPAALRGDALLLFVTAEGLAEIALTGAFARAFGVDARLTQAGWSKADLERWSPLTDPLGPPAMGPDRVFAVIGSEDTVAPFPRGLGLIRRWGVPEGQVHIRRQGHFTVPIGLMADAAPLDAFAGRLREV